MLIRQKDSRSSCNRRNTEHQSFAMQQGHPCNTHTEKHAHARTRARTHAHTYTHTHTHTHTHTPGASVYTHTHMHAHAHKKTLYTLCPTSRLYTDSRTHY